MSRMTAILRLAMPVFGLVAIQLAVAAGPARRQPAPADSPEVLLREYLQALDHGDMDAAKRIARRAAEQSPGPITELMIPHSRLVATGKSERAAKERTRHASHAGRENAYYTVTYSVADLVLPLPKVVIGQGTSPDAKERVASEQPDFDTLIDIITGTIKPTSWEDVGAPGTIRGDPRTLSFIISQTQEVHEEITSLFEQWRRLGDITVLFDTRVVVVPGDVVPEGSLEKIDEWATAPNLMSNAGRPNTLRTTLDAQQLKRLFDTACKSGNVAAFRRFTTINGQMAAMSVPGEKGKTHWIDVQSIVSNDRRRVRLTLVLDQKQTVLASVSDGRALAVDLAPAADKSQEHGRPPADAKARPARRLLLITPRILIAKEEEERLGVLPTAKK
jgi:hypothetical protein